MHVTEGTVRDRSMCGMHVTKDKVNGGAAPPPIRGMYVTKDKVPGRRLGACVACTSRSIRCLGAAQEHVMHARH